MKLLFSQFRDYTVLTNSINPHDLSTFSTDATGQLDILGHDCDALGVNSAQIGVLEQTDQVSLRCFLKQGKEHTFSGKKNVATKIIH